MVDDAVAILVVEHHKSVAAFGESAKLEFGAAIDDIGDRLPTAIVDDVVAGLKKFCDRLAAGMDEAPRSHGQCRRLSGISSERGGICNGPERGDGCSASSHG